VKHLNHTPGPWGYTKTQTPDWYQIEQPGKHNTLGSAYGKGNTAEQNAANASLMAAAPELLDVLETLIDALFEDAETLKTFEKEIAIALWVIKKSTKAI